ncbi:hypothetical protein TNCT_257701 [Trichonephila clavata]|uniref:Uncharacterized protein n=1 Tax=Trichonephila clavata TaxID=2740835 RepID=A0A8X6FZZ8_TRICU|nr:hypothetical protein TNCT_257701 [Trichonephila clavata]
MKKDEPLDLSSSSSSLLTQQPRMCLDLLQNIFPSSSPCRQFLPVPNPCGFEISVNGVVPSKSLSSSSSATHRFMFEDLICWTSSIN